MRATQVQCRSFPKTSSAGCAGLSAQRQEVPSSAQLHEIIPSRSRTVATNVLSAEQPTPNASSVRRRRKMRRGYEYRLAAAKDAVCHIPPEWRYSNKSFSCIGGGHPRDVRFAVADATSSPQIHHSALSATRASFLCPLTDGHALKKRRRNSL
jgi:hypothetical protein